MKRFLYLGLLFSILGCNIIKANDKKLSKHFSQVKEDSSLNSKKVRLIQTVLNLPGVLRYSKVKLYRKNKKNIYLLLQANEFNNSIPSIFQDGYPIIILHKLDSLSHEKLPCYHIKIEITGDKAFVNLFFDITGAVAYGNLNYTDGSWIPDEKFVIGVR